MESVQYYGPKKIFGLVEEGGLVTMTLEREEGGARYELKVPTSVFTKVVSSEPTDWNHVQEIKLKGAVADVLDALNKHGITGGEFKPFLQVLSLSYYSIFDRAVNYQFTGNDESYVPGGDIYFDFTIERANDITKHLDESKNGTTDTAA